MDFLNNPVNQDKQMKQIIEDTDEIIKNFKDRSQIIAEKIEYDQDPMLTIGKKIIHNREEQTTHSLGNEQISLII